MATTARQVEALAQLALRRNLRDRLDGTRSGTGASISRLIAGMENDLLIGLRGGRGALELNRHGIARLEANMNLIPEEWVSRVRAGIAERERKLDMAEAVDEARAKERRAIADARIAKRNAAIPSRLGELALEHGFEVADTMARSANERERLIALWNAIVDADAAL